jgi:hypothetical protein
MEKLEHEVGMGKLESDDSNGKAYSMKFEWES